MRYDSTLEQQLISWLQTSEEIAKKFLVIGSEFFILLKRDDQQGHSISYSINSRLLKSIGISEGDFEFQDFFGNDSIKWLFSASTNEESICLTDVNEVKRYFNAKKSRLVHHSETMEYVSLIEKTDEIRKQRLFSLMSKTSRIGMWEVDLKSGSINWDKITREIHEVDKEYIPNLSEGIAFYKEGYSRDTIQKHVSKSMEDGSSWDLELQIVTQKGKEIWVRAIGYTIFNNNSPSKLVGVFQDIDSTRRLEQKLTRQKERYEIANRAAHVGIWEYQVATNELKWDEQMYALYGVKKEDFAGVFEAWEQSIHPDDKIENVELFENALLGNKKFDTTFRVIYPTKEIHYIRALAYIERDENNNAIRAVGTNWDVTELYEFQEKLKQSELKFRNAFDYSPIGMAMVGYSGNWLRVNTSLCKILGYSNDELLGMDFQSITHPDDLAKNLQLRNELITGQRQSYDFEKRYIKKFGEIVWVQISVSSIRKENNKVDYFVIQVVDVTKQKEEEILRIRAERERVEALNKLQGILDATNDVSVITIDLQGTIQSFNKGAEKFLGYKAEEIIGKHNPKLFHDGDEIAARGRERSKLYNEPIEGFDIFTVNTKHGKLESEEWTYIHKNGTRIKVQLVISSIYGGDNELVGYLGVAIDITRLKAAQNEVQSLLNITSNQNNRLKNFAHIVSHNLRSYASNFSVLLQLSENKETDFYDEIYPLLLTASNNLTTTIDHLNEVATINMSENTNAIELQLSLAVKVCIENSIGLLKSIDAEVVFDVSGDLYVVGVSAYLESVLNNLITNAVKYRSKDRRLILTIKSVQIGKRIETTISDNGQGLDLTKYGSKVFGMYKTFHGNKNARGIGLFISKNQVEAMGGDIEIESEPNNGTTFKISLVAAENIKNAR